ncbi:type II toxin-antitoxin system VapC family toxin [Candidatus Thiothrix sp. Deng01]|uniref:Ribonuclease VapC n=1 Tax=Candidatus Thiothrix phosphatis TaxID=3112415 RepID=A0ABU6CTP9_9GAMM|nr:type II toxin-antitoxin system VapC family toxin [Candidatus Thiothrix sp. Deng01]MEB4589462.1 type II toxin-antitoxin system VapC family toxin [Candidatus Thiothrix sp. Deng01]
MACVVDTCGWIEWLADGVLADQFEPWLGDLAAVYMPTAIQFELYKWVKRESGETHALEVAALTEQGIVTPLSTPISLLAADLALQYGLSFADAIIYATAQYRHVTLVTADDHFAELPDVVYYRKGKQP